MPTRLTHDDRSCNLPQHQYSFPSVDTLKAVIGMPEQSGIEALFCRSLYSRIRKVAVCHIGLTERILASFKDYALPSLHAVDKTEHLMGSTDMVRLAGKMKGVTIALASLVSVDFLQVVTTEFFQQIQVLAQQIEKQHEIPAVLVMGWFGYTVRCGYEDASCNGEVRVFASDSIVAILAKLVPIDAPGFQSYLNFLHNSVAATCEFHCAEFIRGCVLSTVAAFVPADGTPHEKVIQLRENPDAVKTLEYWIEISTQLVSAMPAPASYLAGVQAHFQTLLQDVWEHIEFVIRIDEKFEDVIFLSAEERSCPHPKYTIRGMDDLVACLANYTRELPDSAIQALTVLLAQIADQEVCAFHTMEALDMALRHRSVVQELSLEQQRYLLSNVFLGLVFSLCPEGMATQVLVLHKQHLAARSGKDSVVFPFRQGRKTDQRDQLN